MIRLTWRAALARTIAATLTLGASPALATPAQGGPVAQSASGPLAGSADADGVLRFRAIPYAAPPLGALRWMRLAGQIREAAFGSWDGCCSPAGQATVRNRL